MVLSWDSHDNYDPNFSQGNGRNADGLNAESNKTGIRHTTQDFISDRTAFTF
jgi:hypothetical protein